MSPFLIRVSCFSILIAILLVAVEFIAPKGWGNYVLETKWSYLDNDKKGKEVDLFFVGSSRIYRHIDPDLFDSQAGTHSYNLGSPDSNLVAHIQVIEQLLESNRHSPQTIVLELQHLPRINDVNRHKFGAYYGHDLTRAQLACSFFLKKKDYAQASEHLNAGVDNFFKTGALIRVARCIVSDVGSIAQVSRRSGFVPLDDEVNVSGIAERRANFLANKSDLEKRIKACKAERKSPRELDNADSFLVEELISLAERCDAKNVVLIFLLPPRAMGLVSVFNELPDGKKLDLGDPNVYPAFYDVGSTFDVGHLDHNGANAFSDALASKFCDLAKSKISEGKR